MTDRPPRTYRVGSEGSPPAPVSPYHPHGIVPTPSEAAGAGASGEGADAARSPWSSPLGRWLRGVIDDASSVLPSLGRVIDAARRELEKTPTLGVLFVRFEQWGSAARMFGWRESQQVYESASGIAMDMMGHGLRQLDLPADLGLRGEGFAILLSGPREGVELRLEVVEMVAERVAGLANERLAETLPVELLERVSVQVGAALVRRPEPSATIEDALVAGLVAAEGAARQKQEQALGELGLRLSEVVEARRLTALFQPVAEVESGRVFAFDAIPQGPFYLNLRPGDVLLDLAERTGLRHRVLDVYQHVALEAAEDAIGGAEVLVLRVAGDDLLESAVRVMSLLYRRSTARMTPANVLLLVDGDTAAEHFPASLPVWHSVAEMGFRLGVDITPDRPLPLEVLRELRGEVIRVSGRSVREIHRRQDEFEHLLMLSRFAARHDMHVLAADCGDRREYAALRRAGVTYVQGEFVAPCFSTPTRPELDLP